MDKLKQWVALTVLGCLAVGVGGWFLVVSPKRADASDLRTQAAAKRSSNELLQVQLAQLKAQAKALPAQQAQLARVAAKIPDNPALPVLVRALSAAAADSDVELVSMAPSPPAAVTPPGSPATTTAASTKAAPRSASAASSATGQLLGIAMNVQVAGGYFQIEQFVDRLEGLARAFKVTGLTVAPGLSPVKPASTSSQDDLNSGRALTATINGQVYMAAGRAGTLSAATSR